MFLSNPATPKNLRTAAALPAGIVLTIRLSAIISGTMQDDYGTFILYSIAFAAVWAFAGVTILYVLGEVIWSRMSEASTRHRFALMGLWSMASLAIAAAALVHSFEPLLRTHLETQQRLPDELVWITLPLLVLNFIALRLSFGLTGNPEPSISSDPVSTLLELHPQDTTLLLAALDTHRDSLTRQYRKTRRRNADELPGLVLAIDRIDTIKTEIRKTELRDLAANPRRHSTPTS